MVKSSLKGQLRPNCHFDPDKHLEAAKFEVKCDFSALKWLNFRICSLKMGTQLYLVSSVHLKLIVCLVKNSAI